jgi:hypothetical protein
MLMVIATAEMVAITTRTLNRIASSEFFCTVWSSQCENFIFVYEFLTALQSYTIV